MKLCHFLRWKSYYGREWTGPEDLEAVFQWNEVPYECLKTCRPWGPDESLVAPETCGDERPCFEASSLVPDLPVS